MKIGKDHPLARCTLVWLDGQPVTHCVYADDEDGVVHVLNVDENNRWDGTDPVEKRGKVRIVVKLKDGSPNYDTESVERAWFYQI